MTTPGTRWTAAGKLNRRLKKPGLRKHSGGRKSKAGMEDKQYKKEFDKAHLRAKKKR